jgi:DNA/RNA-binding domain of Phe-tRNA-synthetase-like protein
VKLRLAPDFLDLFPEALIGVVRVRGCDNSRRVGPGFGGSGGRGLPTDGAAAGSHTDHGTTDSLANSGAAGAHTDGGVESSFEVELQRAATAAANRFAGAALAEEPRIACWREAYRRFGASPKQSPSSIESLLRRAIKGGGLRPINPLVDLYNAVSLTHLVPAGGEDLVQVRGDVVLCRAGTAEPPVILLGNAEALPPHPGEVIYRDDVGAICRRWNWREADRTKLTATTHEALLVLEALPPTSPDDLDGALADLAARVVRHCGGQTAAAILDAASPELDLD